MNTRLILPILYKLSATGATQEWTIGVLPNPDGSATIRVIYGQKDGKMQSTDTVIRAGKNIGRANATDAFEQAKAECLSKWKKQLDKGYGESIEVQRPVRKPMLAHDFHAHKKSVKFPAYAQPKLDGIRCIAHRDGDGDGITLTSRMGKPITTMPHIISQLLRIMVDGETWDGELYVHHEKFRNITSWVKRQQPDSQRVNYHIYDVIADGPFPERYQHAEETIAMVDLPNIRWVDYRTVMSEYDLKKWHDKWVSEGYEGAMLRHNGCPYKEGYRSRDLLKFKEFQEEEFEIVGATEGKGRFEGMCVFKCKTGQGGVFDVMPEGNEEQRRVYWENRNEYIGQFLIVRFFEWTDSTPPLPRFPVATVVRDYE